jgi:transcriptional regulator with XRE-family HTH domain
VDEWAFPLREDFQADELRAICQRLRDIRVRRGWTQTDLARRSGLDASTLSQYESGHHAPRSMCAVIMMARALGYAFKLSENEDSFWQMVPNTWRVLAVVEDGDFRTVTYQRIRQ